MSPAAVVAAGLPLATRSNIWYIWSVLLAASSFGFWSERTKVGAALSAPLSTMFLTIFLCNVGLLPSASPVYDVVNKLLVPLAVPLLLFDADLAKVAQHAGTVLVCFLLGSVGTVLGTIAATKLIPLGMGSDSWKIAAGLCARHIGGAVNFVAVAETLQISAGAVVAAMAADNLVVALHFLFLFWVAKDGPEAELRDGSAPVTFTGQAASPIQTVASAKVDSAAPLPLDTSSLAASLTLGCALYWVGGALSKRVFGGRLSAIPITTLVTVLVATALPGPLGRLGAAGSQVGVLFMQLFFAVTGACGSFAAVMKAGPVLLLYSAVQIAVHFGFMAAAGRVFKLPMRELALASNANVGGPTTAAGMAASKGWKTLVLPALLTGILGYAIATFVALWLGTSVLRGMIPL